MVLLRVIVQLIIMLLVPLRADMLSSLILTSETVVPTGWINLKIRFYISIP